MRRTIPVKHRAAAFTYALVVVAFVLGWSGNSLRREHVVTHVRVTHPSVRQILGKPDETVPGVEVNTALAGTNCDVYSARKTIVCHP